VKNLIRYEVAYRKSVFDTISDVGGRNIQEWGLKKPNFGCGKIGKKEVVESRSVIYIDRIMSEQQLVIFPFVQGGEIIGAHNQYKLACRIFFAQISQCIHCVRRLWKLELYVRYP